MRAGELGPLRQWAIEHQLKVGNYLGAEDFVAVGQAHIMADTESLGAAGVAWLEHWATLPVTQRQVRIPTITDPRGTDFTQAARLKHSHHRTTSNPQTSPPITPMALASGTKIGRTNRSSHCIATMTTPGHSRSGFWKVGSIVCAADMRDHYAASQPILQVENRSRPP